MNPSSETDRFAALLRSLIEAGDPHVTAVDLCADTGWVEILPPHQRALPGRRDEYLLPHPLVALGIFLGASALVDSGRAGEARLWLNEACCRFYNDPDHPVFPRRQTEALRHFTLDQPYLWMVLVDADLATGAGTRAADALDKLFEYYDKREVALPSRQQELAAVLAVPDAVRPVIDTDPAWMLARYRALSRSGFLDEQWHLTWRVYERYLRYAVALNETPEAVSFVQAKQAAAARVEHTNYHFYAVAVLASAGLHEDAADAAIALCRGGLSRRWGFGLQHTDLRSVPGVEKTGQAEWLPALLDVPRYRRFVEERIQARKHDIDDPASNPLMTCETAILGGRKRRRCMISKKLLAPGEPIYRLRRYFHRGWDHSRDVVASKTAVETSGWIDIVEMHRRDAYPLGLFFPPVRSTEREWDHPDISRLAYDLRDDPSSLDLDRVIDLLSDPYILPMPFEWVFDGGRREYGPEPELFVNNNRAGEFVELAWILMKCGYGPALLERLARRSPSQADPVMAMLAVFDRADCREAAAQHFGMPDLPDMIAETLRRKPALETMLAMADYAEAHPRWRDALAGALRRYNLHIYSNMYPQVNWYLEHLTDFTLAHGCRFLYFFIHRPDLVPVLDRMIREKRSVMARGAGMYDGYGNSREPHHVTVVLNRLIHAPDDVSFWVETPWVQGGEPARKRLAQLVAAFRKREAARTRSAASSRAGRASRPR